ncbi:hypothetical protein LDG_8857 [Legionella drancourtii LLAP12]|uniref:Uncharacterized protein n=1 Tax=Legionella drancourtii LLAP12 TaxID=658187 RepID=G9EU66_9GAMM|nr:hypothetical protein LDG_8857 [Legionella drancourtii LLAP12]
MREGILNCTAQKYKAYILHNEKNWFNLCLNNYINFGLQISGFIHYLFFQDAFSKN